MKIKSKISSEMYGIREFDVYDVVRQNKEYYIINTTRGIKSVFKEWFEIVK